MSKTAEQAISQLKTEGFRITQIRSHLIELILSKKDHWTIQSLADEVLAQLPSVGVATVYRTVNLLHEKGFLSETRLGGEAARYEVSSDDHHDHLTCMDCGKIVEFENHKIEELQAKVAQDLGFELSDHRMELYAHCKKVNCKEKKK